MNTVKVQNLTIGEGIPKICVPVFERTKEDILKEAERIAGIGPDICEFRLDRFEHYGDAGRLSDVLAGLRDVLGGIPLLLTLRTSAEGGEAGVDDSKYADIIMEACKSGLIDMVDVEARIVQAATEAAGPAADLIAFAQDKGVRVIASCHDFEKTPAKDEIVSLLLAMQETGADIIKIAVMPKSYKDVTTLLQAAKEMHDCHARCPIAAISMGDIGTVSRLTAEAFGSSITFGAASRPSAPGQIGAEDLKEALAFFHEALGKSGR